MQFFGAIENVASPSTLIQNAKVAGNPTDSAFTEQNRSESQCFCIFQELMNRGKYAYVGSWVKYAFGKSSCVSKNPTRSAKNPENNCFHVPIHFLRPTALLWKSFRLRLHCYTLVFCTFPRITCLLVQGMSSVDTFRRSQASVTIPSTGGEQSLFRSNFDGL